MSDVARLWGAGFRAALLIRELGRVRRRAPAESEGLRFADECARHKVLDAVGDLALAGLPLLGAYRSVRGGHKLNHAVFTVLMADRSAWRVVEGDNCAPQPAYADAVGGMVGGMVAPAYGPEMS